MDPAPENSPRPTLKDIAAAAGVSPMSVSLALRNSPRVSAETRARVQALAEKMGYRPNAFAANLVQHRISRNARYQASLAFIHCCQRAEDWKRSGTHSRFRTGALARAGALGYQLEELWLEDPRLATDTLQRLLHHRGIPGLLLSSLNDNLLSQPGYMSRFHGLDIAPLACASVGWRMEQPPIHCASNDQFHSAALAVKQLRALGYQRLGLVISATTDQALDHRYRAGYLAHQDSAAGEPPLPVIAPGPTGRSRFLRWFREWRPDAIISQIPHVLPWLRHAHFSVPGDVAVALLDLQFGRHDEGCAGVNQNHEQVGMAAVDLVVSQIQRHESGCPPYQKSLLIQGEWVHGWSAPGKS